MTIQLTHQEKQIFDLLRKIVSEKAPETTLRVAGGWVRDKILGLESNDIDIAVDNMTGEEFARLLSDKVSVVEANPEQSKHLATAMVRLHGLPIDFVNLRTETYADSRIPEMEFGTPEEDASRRDLTINSMFYNINTGEVEDFCGGMEDLKNKIARTPLEPTQTFLDDPLRILRAIRFATRFGLEMDPKLIEAVRTEEVRMALKTKVSNERVWAELAGKKDGDHIKPGILNGNNPVYGVELIKTMSLMELIFDHSQEEMEALGYTEPMIPWDTDQDSAYHEFSIWNHTFQVLKHLVGRTTVRSDIDPWTALILNLTALLHDIGKRYTGIQSRNSIGRTSYKQHEEVSARIVEVVLTRMKAPTDIINRVFVLIDRHLRPHKLQAEGSPRACRKFARDFDDWNLSVDVAIADNLGKKHFTPEEAEAEAQLYEDLRVKIRNCMPVGDSTKLPRPINGRDLIAEGFTPGPIMGQIMAAIDDALLDDPNLSRETAMDIARTFK